MGPISLQDEAKVQKENEGAGYFFVLQALNGTNTYPSDALHGMQVTISQFLHSNLKLCLIC